jgi:hypothetical protein
MDQESTTRRIAAKRIVPVVVIDDDAQALPLDEALLGGGLDVIEITLRNPAAELAIAAIAKRLEETTKTGKFPTNRTPGELIRLVWNIAKTHPDWGCYCIATQVWLLKVFVDVPSRAGPYLGAKMNGSRSWN